jgi:CDP-diacylglycerol---serine O-phosphatidyltransferase
MTAATPEPEATRRIRYLAPNAITGASMMFGLVSLWSAHLGNFSLAAWMVIYAVLTDRLDGVVARYLHATSDLGVQLDSFADFLNFGVSPAFLSLAYLSDRHDLPYQDGWPRILLMVACGGWVLGAVFRLARYNITSDEKVPTTIFFGVPTTLAGGLLAIWFLVFLKYDPSYLPRFGGPRLLGDFSTPLAVWKYMPIALIVGSYLMASTLPMPKMLNKRHRKLAAFVALSVLTGYVASSAMTLPDLTAWFPTVWIIVFLIWGQFFPAAKALRPPPLFPKGDGTMKIRHQEDLGSDDAAQNIEQKTT